MRGALLVALVLVLTACAGESIVHQYECPAAPPAASCERLDPNVPKVYVCDGELTGRTLIGGEQHGWQQDDVDNACSCIGTRPGGWVWACDPTYDARTNTWSNSGR